MSISSEQYTNQRKKIDVGTKGSSGDGEKSEKSLHSEGRLEGEIDTSGNFFSFNQSYTNIEQNQKIIHEKANSLNRIRSLQQQLKSCKSRSSLWQKAKSEIINLNKYLKLSAISLGCSDSAIMKEFFESINDLLLNKQVKSKDDKLKVVQNKKKEAELFEKLVESNKKKYQLQQKIVQLEHENQKLHEVNETLREKTWVQSTERTSKIREFQEQTLITIQQKDNELSTVLQRNNELKLQLIHLEQIIDNLKNELQMKEKDLVETKDSNEELYLECQAHKRQYNRIMDEQKQAEMMLVSIKEQMQKLVDQNLSLREEIKKKKDEINNLRDVIIDAKKANEAYLKQLQGYKQIEFSKRQINIQSLLQKEETLKRNLRSNSRFAINRSRQNKLTKLLLHSKSEFFLPKQNIEL